METRANFVLIGAFTIAAVVAAFLFLMWVVNAGTSGFHRHYQIVFNGSVSGLSNGALVLFNGLKVGEVTNLSFVERNPNQVIADIDVTNASAPINANTKAQLETQGLTGSATVSLIGGEQGGSELKGENGRPPVIPSLPTATLADLQTKAGYVLDLANKLLVDNAQPLHQTLENAQTFSMALARNTSGVDSALKGLADLGRTIEPLAEHLQGLTDDADALLKAVDPDKIRAIVANIQSAASKADSAIGRADKLIADNSGDVHTVIANLSAVSQTLKDNANNLDTALKGFAELGKTIDPLSKRVLALSEDADKVVKAVDSQKVAEIVDNVRAFSAAAANSSGNFQNVMRDGASFIAKLNETSTTLDSAIHDVDRIVKAVDSQKVSGIVDSISSVATTVRDNRGNIDQTLKDAASTMAKLNESANKVDGVLTAAQGFLGSPGTKGAMQQIGEAAQSVKRLADDVDTRVKEISVGLSRFSNQGLRQYEALAVQGQRVLDDVDQTVRSFKANPSQIIWGSKPSLPEYRGGQ